MPNHVLVQPKDIQEGTANHIRMIINHCAAGEAKEAGYLADDLLDQLVCRALVVTQWVAPLDHVAIQEGQQEAYQRGVREGKAAAMEEARKEMRRRVAEIL